MAEYGVNIKVGVQGQQSINSLAAQIKKITENLDAADKAFGRFQSKLKSFDQRREERKVNDELERRNEIYAATERAQRQLLANDNSRIKALERQAKIQDFISKRTSAVRIREQARRTQFLAGDPGAYATAIGPQEDRVAQIRQRNNQRQIAALVEQNKLSAKAVFNKNLEFAVTRKILGGDLKRNRLAERITALQQRMIRNQQSLAKQKERALAADAKSAKLANLESQRRRQGALSSGLIGGAFPLLFGQGLGASAGGAVGGIAGGLAGGQFGFGLSLIGTTLGAAVDNFVSKIGDLASSLRNPAESLKALEEAGIKVDESVKDQVTSLLEAGRAYDAQTVVLKQINDALGPQAVEQLVAYKSETDRLNEKFQEVSTSIQAEMLPALIGFLRVINGITAVVASKQFREGLGKFFAASPLGVGGVVTKESLKLLGLGAVKKGAKPEKPKTTPEKPVLALKEQLDVLTKTNTVIRAGNDLTKESAYTAARQKVFAETRLAVAQAQGSTDKISLIMQREANKLDALRVRRAEQIAGADEKTDKVAERLSKREKERLERSQKTGAALIRQLERDVALKRASTPLERELLNIAYAKETTQARVKGLLDEVQRTRANELVQEREKLSILEAQVNASLRLAGLSGADLEKTSFFTGDSSKAPGFEAGIGSDLFGREEEALNKFLEKYKEVGQVAQITSALVTTGFADMVSGARTAEQVFADFLNSIAEMLMKTAQQMIAQYIALGVARMFATGSTTGADILSKGPLGFDGGGIFTQGFKATPAFPKPMALGGAVSGNRPYLVGERGPELFVPGAQGNIVSNDAMGGVNVGTINISVENTGEQLSPQAQKQLAGQVKGIVLSTLANERRSGGML